MVWYSPLSWFDRTEEEPHAPPVFRTEPRAADDGAGGDENIMARLSRWTPERRAQSQDLLRRAGYLPRSYSPSGSLDQTFVQGFSDYMRDRAAGAPILQERTVGMFARQYAPSGGGGRGRRRGGGGGYGPPPSYGIGELESASREELRDKLVGYYQTWTAAIPDAPSLEWAYAQALGKQSAYGIEQMVRATPEFRTRYPAMPAGMDVKEYNVAFIDANALAFKVAGRRATEAELGRLFAGDGQGFYSSLMGRG